MNIRDSCWEETILQSILFFFWTKKMKRSVIIKRKLRKWRDTSIRDDKPVEIHSTWLKTKLEWISCRSKRFLCHEGQVLRNEDLSGFYFECYRSILIFKYEDQRFMFQLLVKEGLLHLFSEDVGIVDEIDRGFFLVSVEFLLLSSLERTRFLWFLARSTTNEWTIRWNPCKL